MRFPNLFLLLCASALLIVAGCSKGPSTGAVTGIVTLDGTPIADANVTFYPKEGRASHGKTDSQGKYELTFTQDKKGAVLGEHTVTIITEIVQETDYGADDDYEKENGGGGADEASSKARSELLPKKYCERGSSELTATVEKGDNVVDFPLKSE